MGKTKRKSILGMGLPGPYAAKYGDPVTFQMYTADSWKKFYASQEGKDRLRKIINNLSDKYDVMEDRKERPIIPNGYDRSNQQINQLVETRRTAARNASIGSNTITSTSKKGRKNKKSRK
jgi:hypothetical protein